MKKNIYSLLFLATTVFLSGCGSKDDIPVDKTPQMVKLTAPVILNTDSTVVLLADYLQRPNQIDSVKLDPALMATISADSIQMVIRPVDR
ncbi:MAG TPA: hypothetical protein PKN12_04605, partial [Bacteroidales bacterium]|nr:hypothetical protein [Bacteroidales bacterium]HPT10563.1 hypothetical protein [Bacteroidales bacterium]